MKFSKMIVILVIMLNILFTIGVLLVVNNTGVEPTVLVGSWFTFTTGELWILSSIRKKKINKENKEAEEKDNE